MARYTGAKCKLCRREGEKLFLRGAKCHTKKCPMEQRPYPPGIHTYRGKISEFGKRLREKQKVKRFYGVTEKQFLRYFDKAERMKGATGGNLLILLERRIDNVVHLLGWATSRAAARQLIAHGHILLNNRRHKAGSYLVKPGDVIAVCPKEDIRKLVRQSIEECTRIGIGRPPEWVECDNEKLVARVLRHPTRSEVSVQADENLIVEFCSR